MINKDIIKKMKETSDACSEMADSIKSRWGDDAWAIASGYAGALAVALAIRERSEDNPFILMAVEDMISRYQIVYAVAVRKTIDEKSVEDFSESVASIVERLYSSGE